MKMTRWSFGYENDFGYETCKEFIKCDLTLYPI